MKLRSLAFALIAAGFAAAAAAQSSLEKMKQMRVATTDLNLPAVAQTGKNADAIRANLRKINLPAGFAIELYAIVPDARHMAVANSTNMLFVGTRKTTLWAVTDRNSDGVADEVKPFAPSLNFKQPNGVCWTKDGFLIVVEHNRVLNFPAAEFFYEGPDVAVIEVVPQGQLVPVDEESYNHGARTCRVGEDGKLYITLGQPYNVQPQDKIALYEKLGIGGVIRMDPFNGGGREVYARGMRNPVGITVNPKDKTLWATDNQTDGMGDDTPPGELNRLTQAGAHYGYPWYSGRTKVTDEAAGYKLSQMKPPANIVWPQVEYAAHAAALGLIFYTGNKFPEKYRGGVFVAEHGSWNRTVPIGYRIMFTSLKSDGTADKTEVFADGFLDKETGIAIGRPVDVAQLKDGSLLVSDDFAGAIYRIRYTGQ
ncbi:MAG TPA: PQQ-dependent sugar dehydrogenase [Steroidobacteraceae bacterium]|nr:PQQ-dependent sugar dehydrogenase [Steroidobacteraceae bacterium]